MNIEQMMEKLQSDDAFMRNVTYWGIQKECDAAYAPFPKHINPELIAVLNRKGISQLYTHQAQAISLISQGKNVVVVTPTASGKTLCYNLPVINEILNNDSARSLYLFPTKALSQDQLNELYDVVKMIGHDIKTFTYDGDTPVTVRKSIRQAGHIVVTNPDMLHSGIMPHHTKWVKLFENLKFIVIDEIHTYRGVFGSHMANVIRRLKRICSFYGSKPQFICCSATIANPAELTEKIIEEPINLVNQNGAPRGKKHIVFYNPPVVNKELGIRRSSILETRKIASEFLKNGIQTIIFGRSRLIVEVLITYLKEILKGHLGKTESVRGYRGGYLPTERRSIEKGLRTGNIMGVVSTNALELGIDIGYLDACIMCGYPGTVSSTWQRAGRAGRRSGMSAAIIVASSSPLDQYMIQNPEYFLERSPENGLINPNNLYILMSHIKCAAFELPFEDNDSFGTDALGEILSFLEEEKVLRHVSNRWYWAGDSFPANAISLRSAADENFLIIDITLPKRTVIGEVSRFSAPMLVHEEAIYIHEGQQYQVEELDYDEKKAYVRQVDVDYYTDANLAVNLKVLDVFKEQDEGRTRKSFGDVMVSALVTMFKKIKFDTHENLGWGPVHLPEMEMHTASYWLSLSSDITSEMTGDELQSGMIGIANVLGQIAPLFLMCDPADIHVVFQTRAPFTQQPTIFVYDSCPGGVGLSEKLYKIHMDVFRKCLEVIKGCSCKEGCPSCVGPVGEVGKRGKYWSHRLLGGILNDYQPQGKIEADIIQLPFQ